MEESMRSWVNIAAAAAIAGSLGAPAAAETISSTGEGASAEG
jgi:hypothetical protein